MTENKLGENGLMVLEMISLDDVRADESKTIFYSTHTCWWTHSAEDVRANRGRSFVGGLPCDPRGATLLQTEDVEGFLSKAEAKPDHYGKHGLRAFMAAHHRNSFLDDGSMRHWCEKSWEDYNAAIDKLVAEEAGRRGSSTRRPLKRRSSSPKSSMPMAS